MTESELEQEGQFQWHLQGRIVLVDNGCNLVRETSFTSLMALNSFATIAFDPANQYENDERLDGLEEFQRFPNATLGSGSPATLNACLEESNSATLTPMENSWLPADTRASYRVLARYPIGSVALDAIDGLPNIDWLLLDDKHDNMTILENGAKALVDTLLIQVRIPFRPAYQGQADIAQVSHWMARHGFRFYCFVNERRFSHLPQGDDLEKHLASELLGADALFVPSESRLATMSSQPLAKLSFLLHTIYKIHDFAYAILKRIDPEQATTYLEEEGYLWPVDHEATYFVITHENSPDVWSNTTPVTVR